MPEPNGPALKAVPVIYEGREAGQRFESSDQLREYITRAESVKMKRPDGSIVMVNPKVAEVHSNWERVATIKR
jgi:hypothetical protein